MWDTSGQERFLRITTAYLRGARGVILGYDITDLSSFEVLVKNFEEVYLPNSDNNVTFLLIGNKVDLEHVRQVPTTQGKNWAEKNNMGFFETSAKTGENVEKAVMFLVRKCVENIKHFEEKCSDNEEIVMLKEKEQNFITKMFSKFVDLLEPNEFRLEETRRREEGKRKKREEEKKKKEEEKRKMEMKKREEEEKKKEEEMIKEMLLEIEKTLTNDKPRFSDFTIIKPIGGAGISDGVNSCVYLCEYKNIRLAMKVVLNVHSYQTTKIKSQLIEKEFFRRVKYHKNVVRLFYCVKDSIQTQKLGNWDFRKSNVSQKTAFFIMPFYEDTLKSLIKKKKSKPIFKEEREFFKFLKDCICGLIHLSSHKIAHRDVKEDNIFLNDNTFLIGDFGTCLDSKEYKNFKIPYPCDGYLKGGGFYSFFLLFLAPYYMPEEVYSQSPGKKSFLKYDKYDAFSLGLVCYGLFSDNTPFGESKGQRKKRKQSDYIPLKENECSSKEIRELIGKMLLIDYKKRFSAKRVLKELVRMEELFQK